MGTPGSVGPRRPRTAASAAGSLPIHEITLVKGAVEPLYQQLYTQLRAAVVAGGSWASGVRLPSSRELAGALGVSRNTVVLAYQRLQEDGFVRGMAGGGTVVGRMPELATSRTAEVFEAAEHAPFGLPNSAFPVGVPPVDLFPTALWANLTSRRLRTSGARVLLGAGRFGYRPLREAITGYLWAVRGIRCAPEQIIVTRGVDGGIDLLARTLLRDGDDVWCEEPGYPTGRHLPHGVRPWPVPVDSSGLDVAAAVAAAPGAAMAVVSPARQVPLGVPMSASRRAALLAHAHRTGMWIVEHESDTPFLGHAAPPPLFAADPQGTVIHVGGFNTVLFPQLHVGYCVLPDPLIEPVGQALVDTGAQASGLTQAVLADFLDHHRFARFLNRIATACDGRRTALRDALSRLPGAPLTVLGAPDSGSYLTAVFRRPTREADLVVEANRLSLHPAPLSRYHHADTGTGGLLLGCAATREEAVGPAVRLLAPLLRRYARPVAAAQRDD